MTTPSLTYTSQTDGEKSEEMEEAGMWPAKRLELTKKFKIQGTPSNATLARSPEIGFKWIQR